MDPSWQNNISAFYMLPRLVINFLPRGKVSFNFMFAVPICSDFRGLQNKDCHSFHCFPIGFPWMGPDAIISVFWMLNFTPTVSLSSFTFITRLFSYSFLSAIKVVSYAYLRLLLFPPTILIPPCASSSPAFIMIYSACKLNKQGDNIQPWHTPFLIWN